MSLERGTVGWDIGGAHLKVAVLDTTGGLQHVRQFPTPLWLGLDTLDDAVSSALTPLLQGDFDHVVTMTGELVDGFDNRKQGVAELISRVEGLLPGQALRVFAGPLGFLSPAEACAQHQHVASANWYATAAWLAHRLPQGVLIDVGSTTSDLLPFVDGKVAHRGYSDRERLACGEMIYAGVVRTPVMAVVRQVPFADEWMGLANEVFATMADVYRVLGWLPEGADLHPSADGRDKTRIASMRRLARMLGADLADAQAHDWTTLANFIADRQIDSLSLACQRHFSKPIPMHAPLVGAGVGRFLVERLARRLERPYVDIDSCLVESGSEHPGAGTCAPAAAVALLAQAEALACAC